MRAVMKRTKESILAKVWPLKEPLTNSTLTFEEWVILGADPKYPNGLTSDAQLTLLEKAARSLDEAF
jgi:hypothetical protein